MVANCIEFADRRHVRSDPRPLGWFAARGGHGRREPRAVHRRPPRRRRAAGRFARRRRTAPVRARPRSVAGPQRRRRPRRTGRRDHAVDGSGRRRRRPRGRVRRRLRVAAGARRPARRRRRLFTCRHQQRLAQPHRPGRSDGDPDRPRHLLRLRHLGCDPALGRCDGVEEHPRHQHRPQRQHGHQGRLCRDRRPPRGRPGDLGRDPQRAGSDPPRRGSADQRSSAGSPRATLPACTSVSSGPNGWNLTPRTSR